MPTEQQLIGALRQADAAGDTQAAQRFAELIKQGRASKAEAVPLNNEAGIAENTIAGIGDGLTRFAEGVEQLGREGTLEARRQQLLQLQKSGRLTPEQLKVFEDKLAQNEGGLFSSNENVADRRESFSSTPAGQSIEGKVGSFVGEAIPGMMIPGGAGKTILQRLGSGALGGGAASSTQFVEDGGSRQGNIITGAAFGVAPAGIEKIAPKLKNSVRAIFRGQGDDLAKAVDDFAEVGSVPSLGTGADRRLVKQAESISGKFFGGGAFERKRQDVINKIQSRLDGISQDLSPRAGDIATAGRTIKSGIADGFVVRFNEKQGQLWDLVDKAIGMDSPVPISNTKAMLDGIVRSDEIGKFTQSSKLRQMKELLESTDNVDYSTLREFRSFIGESLSNTSDLIAGTSKAQLKRVYAALSDDISAAADNANASKLFARANKFTKSGHKRIDEFVERVTKKVDPEDVFNMVSRGSDSASTINAVKRSLKPQEWEVVVSSVIKRLGKATDGTQDSAGELFSVDKFLTDWNKLGKAKSALFSGSNKLNSYRANLDKISRVAEKMKFGNKELSNPSGTAPLAINAAAAGGSVAATAATGSMEAMAIFVSMVAANKSAASLMTNDKFVQWLAQTSRVKPSNMARHIGRLSGIANASNNADALGIQELLEGLQEPSERQ